MLVVKKRYQNNEHSVDARSPAGKGASILSLAESRLIVTGKLLCIYCEPSLQPIIESFILMSSFAEH